jgi:N-dimethylarginine dimethylaminohydrolase
VNTTSLMSEARHVRVDYVINPYMDTTQLRKGGGGVRCTALTLDNP